MEGFLEYAFTAVPTRQERQKVTICLFLAIVCMIAAFFFWPLVLGAVLFAVLAWTFNRQLDYEYEYVFSDEDLSVDQILRKEKRKTLVLVPYSDIEEITATKPGEHPGVPVRTFVNPEDPILWLVCNGKAGKRVYGIQDNDTVRSFLKAELPRKAFGLKTA